MPSTHHDVILEKMRDFSVKELPALFDRDLSLGSILEPSVGNLVKVVVGVRRCGKTYRLYQEMKRIVEAGYGPEQILYFNFDDERLKPFEKELLDDVVEAFFAERPHLREQGAFFFFDEIQEVPEWGAFMRRMVDTRKATIYVTGSSSKMLSTQLASEFRGRALSYEMFPMSFSEYVRYHHPKAFEQLPFEDDGGLGAPSSAQRSLLRRACQDYLLQGGFIATQALEASDATQLLQEYANRTVNYDIIERYNIGNPRAAALFLARCIASSGRELSISKTYNDFKSRQVTVGRETLAQLLAYYEESFLLFAVRNHSVALADNPRSTAKLYAADPALLAAFSPAPATDYGQRLETAVFNRLQRTVRSARPGAIARAYVGDGAARQEIDFVVGDALAMEEVELIQVCASLADPKTRKRELGALEMAMGSFGVRESWLVTTDEEEAVEADAGIVHILPAWKWLI